MAEWQVQLLGDDLDLSTLVDILQTPELNVLKDGDTYYLRGSALEQHTSADTVRAYAEALLPVINGASKMTYSDARPLTLGAIYRINDDGHRDISVYITQSLSMRTRALVSTATGDISSSSSNPPISTLAERVQIGQSRTEVNLALLFFGSSLNWFNLYKVCEIIEQDMGGWKKIVDSGWTTKAALDHFTGSANNYNSTGADARHARLDWSPMKQPAMTLPEAQGFIGLLLDNWIRSK